MSLHGPFSDDDFQAEQDIRTLREAEEIRKNPNRMAKARDKAKETIEATESAVGVEGSDHKTVIKGFRKL